MQTIRTPPALPTFLPTSSSTSTFTVRPARPKICMSHGAGCTTGPTSFGPLPRRTLDLHARGGHRLRPAQPRSFFHAGRDDAREHAPDAVVSARSGPPGAHSVP